ncbi:hypothetical protein D7X88_15065 [bacterium C-53]|nr:hypothetical protein [Lachnospiraceae bacterium]NBI02218.1 hypothetical protein [Lachnospiraceae bacterium]RKJ08387.1 hypothetical protein D7X88_15065 [bacterium C-53]
MNTISGFGAYQSSFYQNTLQERKEKNSVEEKKTDKTEKNPVQLSSAAKKLLKEIQKKYGDMDIMVGRYETEEEATAYLAKGTKSFGVLIDPEELEEMAQDEDLKEKNLNLIDEAVGKLSDMQDQLGDKKDDVAYMGVSIGKDGKVSYFAELEKGSAQQKERIEESREAKKEQAAQEEKKKRTRVRAESVEELIEKIRAVDWNNIKEEKTTVAASKFDFSI